MTKTADAHMRGLLNHMRAAPAGADDADRRRMKNGVAMRTKKALPVKAAHAALHVRMGIPTSVNKLTKDCGDLRSSHTWPKAAVSLRTIAP